MNKYLKYQHPWIQLILFGTFTVVFFLVALAVIIPIVANAYGLGPKDLTSFDYSKPQTLAALKMLQSVFSLVLFFIPSLLFAYLSAPRPMHYIGFRKPVPEIFFLFAVLIILSAIPMVAWLGTLNRNFHLPKSLAGLEQSIRKTESENDNMVQHLLNMHSPKDLVSMLVIVGVIPAVVEELFFRGVLQRLFIQITRSPWFGIIITSVIFSAIHGQFLGFVPRAVLGMVLGGLFWYSGSLWPGILAHFINNALQVILVYYNPKLADSDPTFAAWVIAASTLAVAALLYRMRKASQTSYAEVYDTDDDFHIGPRDQYTA